MEDTRRTGVNLLENGRERNYYEWTVESLNLNLETKQRHPRVYIYII